MLSWKWLLFSWSYWNLCILLNYFHCGSNYLKGKKICVVWASDVSPWKHKPGHGTVGSHLMATRTSGDYPDSCLTGENTNYQTIPATDTHSDTTWEAQCLLLTWASVMCDDICQVSNISSSTAHLASSAVLNIRYSSILCSQDYSSARASAIPLPQQAKTVWHRSDALSKFASKNIFPKYEFFYLYFLWKTCTWIEN